MRSDLGIPEENPIDDDYSAWSNDDLRAFIVEHTEIKPDAHLSRDELINIVACIPDPT